jgi:hypothetical protein
MSAAPSPSHNLPPPRAAEGPRHYHTPLEPGATLWRRCSVGERLAGGGAAPSAMPNYSRYVEVKGARFDIANLTADTAVGQADTPVMKLASSEARNKAAA